MVWSIPVTAVSDVERGLSGGGEVLLFHGEVQGSLVQYLSGVGLGDVKRPVFERTHEENAERNSMSLNNIPFIELVGSVG